MLRLIIRSNVAAPDMLISGDTEEHFKSNFDDFLHLVRNETSELYLSDKYLLLRLLECVGRLCQIPEGFCPLIFDSWSCFNSSPPGIEQFEECPNFPKFRFSGKRSASKFCTENGSWWTHPLTNRTWSNYTNCVDFNALNFHSLVNNIALFGLGFSLFFLLLSLVIFNIFKSLSCTRISVHKNFFLSLSLNNISWLVWYSFVLFDPHVFSSNILWCRVLHVITIFFTLTTYFWMLCEGTYLLLLLKFTLQIGQDCLVLWSLRVVGWLTPLLVVVPYVIYKQLYENESCWMDTGSSQWFLGVPVIIIILSNIAILSNVIFILKGKLSTDPRRETQVNQQENPSWKQIKAVMLLISILGINYVLVPIRPKKDTALENAYDIIAVTFSSFQGCFVAFLLCFTNSEVISQMKRRWAVFTSQAHYNSHLSIVSSIRRKRKSFQGASRPTSLDIDKVIRYPATEDMEFAEKLNSELGLHLAKRQAGAELCPLEVH